MKSGPLMLLAMVAGCGATVHSSMSPNTNLSQYKTFSFYSSPYKQGKPETMADQDIRSGLKQNLAAKGVMEASGAQPDFLVSYHVIEQQKLQAEDVGYAFGGVDWSTYTQGTLVVDFIDPQSRRVFWRGTASEIVDDPNNVNTARLDKAIAKLISHYPYDVATMQRPAM